MKKIYLSILLIVMLLLSACGQNAGDKSPDAASEENVIRVGATPDGYPQYFKEDEEMKGFSVDVIEAAFERAGYQVEWVLTDWSGVLANMQTGDIDTIANFAITEERQDIYNYTDPYYHSKAVIAIGENNDKIQSLDDLKGKQVASVLGSNYKNVLEEMDTDDEIEIVDYDVKDVIINDVASEKVDGYVSGREILLAQINDKDIPLKIIGEPFGDKPVALPFSQDEENKKLVSEMNQIIEELLEDGTISELSQKWYGVDVTKD